MADHKNNPFAICRAMGKRLGWSDAKVEECVLDLKKETGIDMMESEIPIFVSRNGRGVSLAQMYEEWFQPESDGSLSLIPESWFEGVEADLLAFIAAPFSVYGGKRFLASKIAPLIPAHTRYVEPFAGAASIMFAKKPSAEEILIDVDNDKVDALGFLKTYNDADHRWLASQEWGISKDLFNKLMESEPKDRNQRFRRFMYLTWNSFGKRRDSFANHKEYGTNAAAYFEKRMPRYKERLQSVRIFTGDWKSAVKHFDGESTFFYLDPPYIGTSNARAAHFKEPPALELGAALKGVKAKWIMSNADVPELHDVFKDSVIKKIRVPTGVDKMHKGAKTERIEVLIANFDFHLPQEHIAASE